MTSIVPWCEGKLQEHSEAFGENSSMEATLVFKGQAERVVLAEDDTMDKLFQLADDIFSLAETNVKLLCKGKRLERGAVLRDLQLPIKVMVMATGKREVSDVQAARSDPTVRGFQSEDELSRHHAEQQASDELSVWGTPREQANHRPSRVRCALGMSALDAHAPARRACRASHLSLLPIRAMHMAVVWPPPIVEYATCLRGTPADAQAGARPGDLGDHVHSRVDGRSAR
jgi:hypothetical protein